MHNIISAICKNFIKPCKSLTLFSLYMYATEISIIDNYPHIISLLFLYYVVQ